MLGGRESGFLAILLGDCLRIVGAPRASTGRLMGRTRTRLLLTLGIGGAGDNRFRESVLELGSCGLDAGVEGSRET